MIYAAEYAKTHQISVIALTGKSGSQLGEIADIDIPTIEFDYADKIQELHIKILHWCYCMVLFNGRFQVSFFLMIKK